MANSSMLVLPRMIAPACFSRWVIVASYGGCQPSRIREPQVVGMPLVVKTSLTASGTPASGPSCSPLARLASTPAACASARSAATCRKACTRSSTAAIRSRWAWATSVAETCFGGQRGGQFRRGHAGQFHGSVLRQDPRDPEPLLLDGGRLVEGFGRGEARPGSSSRNTLVRPVAWEVGGMPSAATSWTCATAVMIWFSWGAR